MGRWWDLVGDLFLVGDPPPATAALVDVVVVVAVVVELSERNVFQAAGPRSKICSTSVHSSADSK